MLNDVGVVVTALQITGLLGLKLEPFHKPVVLALPALFSKLAEIDACASQAALAVSCLRGVKCGVVTRQLGVARAGPRNKACIVGSVLAAAKRDFLDSGYFETKGRLWLVHGDRVRWSSLLLSSLLLLLLIVSTFVSLLICFCWSVCWMCLSSIYVKRSWP